MHCLPVVNVSRPDTVQLSGSTTLKVMKVVYNWTVSGFDVCPEDTENIRSPIFCHPNLSKWCLELEKDDGTPRLCFRLVASNLSLPVDATLKAVILDRDGEKHYVYPPDVHCLKVNETSPLLCLLNDIDTKELGEDWNFECEVSTLEVLTEDTSDASEEEVQLAVVKDLECLLDSEDLTDITLSAGGVHLKAHRAILCARSPVFRAMLSHDTKEAQEGLVDIPDVEPEVMSEVLRYMYTDRVQAPSDMAGQLLVASDKYGLQDAKLKYELELANQLTIDTVASIAVYAIVHSCCFLQNVCVTFIKQNLHQVVGTRSWANIIDENPEVVKTICKLVTKGSERCSSSPATSVSQCDAATTEKSPATESESDCCTPVMDAGSSDTVWDSGYTGCERKKVVYVWTVSGLNNWPQQREYVASPHFCYPETIQWELRLYKCGTEYDVRIVLLENKAGGSVMVDLSISVIPPGGEKCKINTSTDCTFDEGSESDKFECGYLVNDVLTVECEISMVCGVQQSVIAVKPVLQSGLRQDLQSLLESGSIADFKLSARTVEMGAHRAVLGARSPFFARMLQPGSEVLKKGLLEVPDVKPEVLAEILHYIYTGRVKNLSDSTGELLVAAHRFELCDLQRQCLSHMTRQLNVGNAVAAALCALENECDALLNLSVGYIRSHFQQVLGTAEWMEAIDTHPALVKTLSQLVSEHGK